MIIYCSQNSSKICFKPFPITETDQSQSFIFSSLFSKIYICVNHLFIISRIHSRKSFIDNFQQCFEASRDTWKPLDSVTHWYSWSHTKQLAFVWFRFLRFFRGLWDPRRKDGIYIDAAVICGFCYVCLLFTWDHFGRRCSSLKFISNDFCENRRIFSLSEQKWP